MKLIKEKFLKQAASFKKKKEGDFQAKCGEKPKWAMAFSNQFKARKGSDPEVCFCCRFCRRNGRVAQLAAHTCVAALCNGDVS